MTATRAAIAAALLAAIVGAAAPARAQDSWTGPDKRLHLGVSAVFGMAARSQWPNEPWRAWAWAMVPGLAKEIIDATEKGNRFSVKDLVANGIGAYLGVKLGGLLIGPRSVTYRRDF